MIDLYVPQYYNLFKCKAEKCKNNCCCEGWEICVDEETEKYYRSIQGEFGEKLKNSLKKSDDGTIIKLNPDGVCPLLDNDGLCEVIKKTGGNLCQICRDHPRYFRWFSDRKEGGVGMACEEAARIILTDENPFEIIKISDDDDNGGTEDDAYIEEDREERKKIFSLLENNAFDFNVRICAILQMTEQKYSFGDIESDENLISILRMLVQTEPLNDKWSEYCDKKMHDYDEFINEYSFYAETYYYDLKKYFKNITEYFVWRYFLSFEYGLYDCIKITAVSLLIIFYLLCCNWIETGESDLENIINTVTLFSKQIEYSDVNMEMFSDYVQNISDKNLESLCRKYLNF